ncbi:hypothetical protein OPV22_026965 [Ensete ventricosum]|uniref:protein-serine/threonine phosphatase n=1 Tax=Ensete ventricosum TaxID=4639 RepID=A0AAV8Q2I7_ENSVE|nr:hypothetical protein OPV22_026965 [Ensete ventricosum]
MEAPTRDDNNDDANRHPILSIRRGYRRRHCLLHNPDPPKRIRRAEGERSQSVYGTAPLPQDDGTGKIDEKDATDAPPLRRASCLQSLAHGSMSVLGRRRDMEDAVTEVTGLAATAAGADGYAYFAVYDGHGGPMVARACRDRLHVVVAEEVWRRRAAGEGEGEGPEMWWRALEAGFARVDAEVMEASRALKKGTVGSTAVVAEKWIVVANCGDSRAVLSRSGVAVPLSIDHKVEFPSSFYPHFFRSLVEVCYHFCGRGSQMEESMYANDFFENVKSILMNELVPAQPDRPDELRRVEALGTVLVVLGVPSTSRVIGKCLEVLASDGYPCGVANSAAKEAAAVLVRLAISRGSFRQHQCGGGGKALMLIMLPWW